MTGSSRSSFWVHAIVVGSALPVLTATPAAAYVGPGAGLTAIGTILGVLAALVLAVVGFIWYPMKRLLRRRKADQPATVTGVAEDGSVDSQAAARD